MTEEKQNEFQLDFFKKPVVIIQKKINMSSDSGLLLFKEADSKAGYIKDFANLLTDRRTQKDVDHSYEELLSQRVYGILGGYEDQNDAYHLRKDPIIKLTADRGLNEDSLGSQATISRFENHMKASDFRKLKTFFIDKWAAGKRKDKKDIYLYVDSSALECHGEQEYALFNGYYKVKCYHPLFIYDGETGELLFVFMRRGNVHSGRWSDLIIGWLIKEIRKRFPKSKIHLKADSGFAKPSIYKICESNKNIDYYISISEKPILKKFSTPLLEECVKEFEKTKETVIRYGECGYRAAEWDRFRRIIFKIEVNSHGTKTRYVVVPAVNQKSPKNIYAKTMERCEIENRIKEYKSVEHINGSRMSCSLFLANKFRAFMYGLAYSLVCMTRQYFKGSELENAQTGTLRQKIIKTAAWVEERFRRIIITISDNAPYFKHWNSFINQFSIVNSST